MNPYEELLRGGAPESARAYPPDRSQQTMDFRRSGWRALLYGQEPPSTEPLGADLTEQAAFLMQRLAELLQNTNFTASEPTYNQPHFWSFPIDESVRHTLPAAAGVYQTALTIKPPLGRALVINQYGFNVRGGAFTYNGDILFQILKNGAPVPGLQDIAEQRGTLILPAKTFIILDSERDSNIQFQVRRVNVAGAPDDIDIVLRGWTWRPLRPVDGPAVGIAQ